MPAEGSDQNSRIIVPTADELEKLGVDPSQFRIPSTEVVAHRAQIALRYIAPDLQPKYEPPPRPLQVEVIDASSGLGIPAEELELLLSIARWETPPPFHSGGRSAWMPRTENLISTDESQTGIAAFKIKGIGGCMNGAAFPPRDEQYFQGQGKVPDALAQRQILIHKGIAADGSFYPVLDTPKPLGGMTLARAENEFKNARHLWLQKKPAVRPVAYGKYPYLHWRGEPMGFVILATDFRHSHRVGDLYEARYDEQNRVVQMNPLLRNLAERLFDIPNQKQLGLPMLRALQRVTRACGITLRGFHEAGLARFAGHSGNFSFNPDTGKATQHDLDSVVSLESLAEGSRGLSIIRDIESALVGLLHSIMYSEIYKQVSVEDFERYNLFKEFLGGYFGNQNHHAEIVSRHIMSRLWKVIREMPPIGTLSFIQYFGELSQELSTDFMEWLMRPYEKSVFAERYPLPYGPGEIYRNHAKHFNAATMGMAMEETLRRAPVSSEVDRAYYLEQLTGVGRR